MDEQTIHDTRRWDSWSPARHPDPPPPPLERVCAVCEEPDFPLWVIPYWAGCVISGILAAIIVLNAQISL